MRFACCCTVLLLAALTFSSQAAVLASHNDGNHVTQEDSSRAARSDESSATAVPGNWAMIARVADECARDKDTVACVAVKTATALERAARMNGNVNILPGLLIKKNTADEGTRDSRSLPTEEELRGQLAEPATGSDHTSKVTEMVFNSALRFLQSRTFQFTFPQTNPEELSRAIEEGRGKLKKKVLPILGLLAVKIAAVLPILLGIIGFFALKALLFGKLALLIAGVMAFQKYASTSGGFGKIADNWSAPNVASAWPAAQAAPSTNGYYRRSMEAQQMAYNGQMQPSAQTVA